MAKLLKNLFLNILDLESIYKMNLKENLTKEFFVYIFFRLASILFMTIALFYMFFSKDINYLLGIVLFLIGIIFLFLTTMRDRPKLANCLKNKNFFISFLIKTSLILGVSLFSLSIIFGFENSIIEKNTFLVSCFTLVLFGVFSYVYCCKKIKN